MLLRRPIFKSYWLGRRRRSNTDLWEELRAEWCWPDWEEVRSPSSGTNREWETRKQPSYDPTQASIFLSVYVSKGGRVNETFVLLEPSRSLKLLLKVEDNHATIDFDIIVMYIIFCEEDYQFYYVLFDFVFKNMVLTSSDIRHQRPPDDS